MPRAYPGGDFLSRLVAHSVGRLIENGLISTKCATKSPELGKDSSGLVSPE